MRLFPLLTALMLASCGGTGDSSDQTSSPYLVPSCTDHAAGLTLAIERFAPTSTDTCVIDADCGLFSLAITRDAKDCLNGCPMAMATTYGTEFSSFLATDPGITNACESMFAAHCAPSPLDCVCHMLSNTLQCSGAVCNSGRCE